MKKDAGKYFVVAKNDIGEAQTSCQLNVTCPPCFRKQMKDMVVMTDETVKFEVEAEGKPTPEIKWYKDGQLIVEDERIKLICKDEEVFTLVIKKAKYEDSGSYSCHIKNESGSQTGFGTLTVNAPPVFIRKMKCIESEEDETAIFNVKISGNPKPKAKWLKDEVEIKANDKHWKVEEDGNSYTLIIDRVKKEDVGNYTCYITNEYGSLSDSGSLTVKSMPNFEQRLTDLEALEEDTNVELHVKAEGTPQPKITWYFENMEITENENYKITYDKENGIYKLILKKVTSELSGKYSCEAVNSIGKAKTSGIISVNAHPKFVQGLKDIEGIEEQEVLLTVKVAGEPKPNVTWIKDGTELTIDGKCMMVKEDASDSFTLVLNRVTKEDAGEYKCRITNKYGEESTGCKLTVKAHPKFVQGLKDIEGIEEQEVLLTVKVAGEPKPNVTWIKDGTELTIDGKCMTVKEDASDSFTLVLNRVTKEDAGEYKCRITNKYGEESTSCKLTVKAHPKFVQGLKDIEGIEEQEVLLTVKVASEPKPNVTWIKDGTELTIDGKCMTVKEDASDSFTLVLNRVTKEDAGEYKCRITNKYGEESTSCKLTVKAKPKFIRQLSDKESKEGDNVEFTCQLDSDPIPEIKWMFNDKGLVDCENYKIVSDEALLIYTLKIKRATAETEGVYSCEASNKFGKVSSYGVLSVNAPPVFIQKLEDVQINEGEAVSFRVKVMGKPKPSLKWFHNDTEVTIDGKHYKTKEEASDTFTLIIDKSTRNDIGQFSCEASNTYGKDTSCGKLCIKSKPIFRKKLEDLEAREGDTNVQFVVEVEGTPKPTLSWFIDELDITSSENYKTVADEQTGVYKLIIRNISTDFAGKYTCEAANSCGKTDCTAIFIVSSKPKLLKGLNDIDVQEGETVHLTVKINGSPTPNIKWTKDGEELNVEAGIKIEEKQANTYVLEIEKTTVNSSGEYTCRGSNKLGEVSTTAKVNVLAKPKFVKGMEDKEVWAGEKSYFEVKVLGHPEPTVKWLKEGEELKASDYIKITSEHETHKLIIQNTHLEDSGVYSCHVKNKAGECCQDAMLSVKSADDSEEPIFIRCMVDTFAVIGDTTRFEVKVIGKPKPEVLWFKDGEQLSSDGRIKISSDVENNYYILTVNNLALKDSGKYSCTATNDKGSASVKATITVMEPVAPEIEGMDNIEVKKGMVAKFEVKASGHPVPDIKWLKAGMPIQFSDHIMIKRDNENRLYTLTVQSVMEDDVAVYTCVASNSAGKISKDAKISLKAEPPRFLKDMVDIESEEGKEVEFEVCVSGYPQPEVVWCQNMSVLTAADSHVNIFQKNDMYGLNILKVTEENIGTYSCTAKNIAGEAKSTAVLRFQEKLPVVEQALPQKMFITEGEKLNLEGKIVGYPLPDIRWTKNGEPIQPSDKFKMEQTSSGIVTLTVEDAEPSDSGNYAIIANNNKGKISSESKVSVEPKHKLKPEILQDMLPAEVTVGQPAKLKAQFCGQPKPLITWLKNGEEVSPNDHIKVSEDDDGNVELTIDSSITEDSGKYTVVAVNEAGDVSTGAKLTVKNPSVHKPEIKDGLKATEFIEDHPGYLEIKISTEPKAKVKWTKDGQEILPSEHFTIVEKPDGIVALIIDNVTPQDAGKYTVIVYNDEGRAESEARVTTVCIGENLLQTPECVHKLQPTQLIEGEPGKLETKVLGVPKPDISWLKDGEEIQPSNHMKMLEKPDGTVTLLLDKVTPEDAGKYTLVARNDKGVVRDDADVSTVPPSTKAEKSLPKKPEFEHHLKPTLLTEEKPGKLEVVVTGEPKPEVQWFKDGKVIQPSRHVKIVEKPDGTAELLLDKVSVEDAGRYCIVARNEKGEIKNEADVTTVPPSRKTEKLVAKTPEFEHRLRPALLTEEEPGKLEAVICGVPKPKVNWFKDGKAITPNEHFTPIEKPDGTVVLLIDKVTPEDAGKFGVVVTSDDGEIKSEANVTTVPKIIEEPIGKRPEFIRTLSPVELQEGHSLKLEAKVIGDPAPNIRWFKDNQEILSSEHTIMLEEPNGTVSLLIENVTPVDAGKYAVVASNSVGKSRSFAFVDITALPKREPEFLELLKPMNLTEGQSGRWEVLIKSDTKPEIKWLKNGQEVKPDDQIHIEQKPDGTQALIFDKVKPEDTGIYSVLAANHHGESRSSAPLIVDQQPLFKKPLQDVEAVEGFPGKLEAQVFGVPQPEVKWFKDGRELNPHKDNVKVLQLPDNVMSLIISSCHPEDSGKYSCIAKNPLGECSSDGNLTVKGKEKMKEPQTAPSFLTSFRDVFVKEGEIISFEADVGGNPLPEIKWYLNNLPITESDNISKMFDGKKAVLEIRRCKPQHGGVYECQLTNSLGEARIKGKADVAAHIPPRFIQRLYNTNICISEPLNLTCRVKGDPEPQIEWYFNGSLIEPGLKYNMKRHDALCQLTILRPHINDSGLYECRATNIVGSDSCNAEVKVSDKVEKEEAPKFLKKIGDCEVSEGATAKFTACIVGTPQPDVKWIKDGMLIEPSTRYKMESEPSGVLRLIIHNVHPMDVGDYSLMISNSLGSESCTAHMQLESLDSKFPQRSVGEQYPGYDKFRKTGAPVPLPDKPRILRMTDHNLTLAWKPSLPASPRVPVTYSIEMSKYPDGEWKPYKSGIKDSSCDIRGLVPCQDYRFRIRVENKYGTSDPSPYVTAHRSKLELLMPADFKPKDFKIEHPPLEKHAAPPKFLRKEEEIMYGIRSHPVTIEFWIYGYPEPKITWYFKNQKIEFPVSKYDSLQDRNGQICLFLKEMTEADEGTFMCHAVNEHGDTRQKIKLMLAEPPSFSKRLNETTIMLRRSGRLECQVTGIPSPAIRWFKDWHPLYESSRIKIFTEEPNKCIMYLSGSILKDSGLYSVTVSNIAGSASCSAALSVEEADYNALTYAHPHSVKPKIKPFEDYYDIGDELGRGTQGIVYHTVERISGNSYAAKMMHGKGKLRDFMDAELDIMNQLCHPRLVQLFDAFETKSSLTLVTDLCGGGELLDNILKRGKLTEKEVAHYIRQVLEGLEHMHSKNIAHLGLTIGDILVTRVNGDIIKLGDFGLAQHLHREKENFLDYGHPEFVAPEIVNKEPTTLAADMWSIGVITYLLLSGISPFLGENDRETLKRVQTGKITFFEDAFAAVSDDARDFISRLLVFSPSGRIDVKTALEHPWLKFADTVQREEQPLNVIDRLHEYYKKWKNWYANASCKRFYRRRPLESCYTHPSKMIYPPDELYTPPSSPEPELNRTPVKPAVFDDTFQQKISREPIDVRSESHYQNGPDTYLLQYRDTDFPLRVRQYLRVGAHHSPSLAASLKESHWGDTNVAVRERRRFLDVWDEEMDDEKKGVATRTKPMRLHHELGSLGYAREQIETLKNEAWKDKGKTRETLIGMEPYFREKIKDVVIQENDEVVFSCYAIGEPAPSYTWFRNDGILIESGRIMSKKMPDGRCELHLKPGKVYDVGVYKCIARNLLGSVTCRARLKIGGVPGRPDAPDVEQSSDTEILLVWYSPKNEGNSPTLCYCLEYKQPGETTWIKVSDRIDHEFYVVRDLSCSTTYHFRITAKNRFGWSESSLPSEQTSTLALGAPKVKITKARKYRQEMTERGHEIEMNEFDVSDLDYSIEQNPVPMIERDPMEMYNFVSEIARGRFSVVVKIWVKEMGKTLVGKVIHTSSENESDVLQEYDIFKSLRHERIASLEAASRKNELTILVMEKLSGIDILTYLTSHHEYTEDTVAKVITQVLNAIEYLHFRGICCLEIQPDNVVMINHRRPDIKLVDLGSASYVPKTGKKIDMKGKVEYLAPEIVKKEEVSTATDVWAVGVLTYILLSGVSPFRGETDKQTEDNIEFIRYQFENLHAEVTQEVTRFLMYLFKRTPEKRATVQECLENKWLLPSEFIMKKRENAIFLSHRLHEFSESFHNENSHPHLKSS
ncbi:protein Obscurin-like isoform X2 [Tachypleus tridentatus]|uniref:protein Obscurin-like isoform X2 n=1 Tax=Tachypleus tridentatus TaxID=6853 RepID=UPI003FD64B04